MRQHIDASIIVVSCNKLPYTRLCVESLLQSRPWPAEIVLVDNGSQDGSVDYLAGEFSQLAAQAGVNFVLVCNDSNVGACTARNQALEVAKGKYIAFMDNDAAVRSGNWLQILQDALEQKDDIGIAGPKLVFPFPPYNIEIAGAGISPNGRVQYRGRGKPLDSPEFNKPEEVQCLISACWLMKREVCEQIGGLDEVFNPAQYEDLDFCYRAREAGWRVWYQPAAEMYHYENVTLDGSPDLNFRYITIKNGLEFKRRWQHMFSQEGGPPDEECRWEPLPTETVEQTGIPQII